MSTNWKISARVSRCMAGLAACWVVGVVCVGWARGAEVATEAGVIGAGGLVDEAVEGYRVELLDFAYETASTYPVTPHIKNRSRGQESVVKAGLELGQVRRALGNAEGIRNWRKGSGYAAVGVYLAERGAVEEAERLLGLAELIAGAKGLDSWRAAEIRGLVVEGFDALGREEDAARVQGMIEGLERVQAVAMKALRSDELSFEEKLEALDGVAGATGFEMLLFAAESFGVVLDDCYRNTEGNTEGDAEKRAAVADRVRRVAGSIPVYFRVVTWSELAEVAVRHGDGETALGYVAEAERELNGAAWDPVNQLPLMARLARIRFESGDESGGIGLMGEAEGLYGERGDSIRDYERADVLRPMAEAKVVMGDVEGALEMYRAAVVAGALNPNRRPRTDDLTATSVSMAVAGVEPDDSMWGVMRGVYRELAAP